MRLISVRIRPLFGFAVGGVLPAETAVLAELQLIGSIFFVLGRRVIPLLAFGASQGNDVPHIGKSFKPPPGKFREGRKK
jgi:hypothetical protein